MPISCLPLKPPNNGNTRSKTDPSHAAFPSRFPSKSPVLCNRDPVRCPTSHFQKTAATSPNTPIPAQTTALSPGMPSSRYFPPTVHERANNKRKKLTCSASYAKSQTLTPSKTEKRGKTLEVRRLFAHGPAQNEACSHPVGSRAKIEQPGSPKTDNPIFALASSWFESIGGLWNN